MKKVLLLLSMCLLSAQTISVQGVLRDSDNQAVDNGTYTIGFEIYDSASGGSLLWSSSSISADVVNGVYSADLDIGDLEGDELWIQTAVNGEVMSDRVRLYLSPSGIEEGGDVSFNNVTANDITASGAVHGSTFHGDGSALTGINSGAQEGGDVSFNKITVTDEVLIQDDLFINDDLFIYDNSGNNNIRLRGQGTYGAMDIYTNNPSVNPIFYLYGKDNNGNGLNADMILSNSGGSNTIRFQADWNDTGESMMYAGNVCVGCTYPSYPLQVLGTSFLGGPAITSDYMHIDNDAEYPVLYAGADQNAKFLIRPGHGTSYRNSISIDGELERVGINVYDPWDIFDIQHRFMFGVSGYWNYLTIRGTQPAGSNSRLYFYGADNDNNGADVSVIASMFEEGSDRKLKDNIRPIGYGLSTVMELSPKEYNLKKSYNRDRIGFIAQDVMDVLPQLVSEPGNGADFYSLNYSGFTPVLTKAIQELKIEKDAEIDELNKTINQLMKRIEQLENR